MRGSQGASMMAALALGLALAVAQALPVAEVSCLHLVPSPNIERSDLYYSTSYDLPSAVLVLCPGCNGNGESLVRSHVWQQFAHRNHLGLVGLSFSSPEKAIDGTREVGPHES